MDFNIGEHPGQLYVVATLLPAVSFVVLLLAGALRLFLRSNRDQGLGETLYLMLGGDKPAKWPAYIATGAISLSFVLCLIGFIWFAVDQTHASAHGAHAGHNHMHGDHEEPGATQGEEPQESKWAGHIDWAQVLPAYAADKSKGTLLQLGYRIDSLSATMFLMVTFVASLIHLFSIGYMSDELNEEVTDHQVHTAHGHLHRRGRFGRFFLFMSLFCFSMLNLILADNLFQVFLSWELVGICSYLLIGFYYERTSAANASNKAFITNRIGDAGFIIGLLIIWTHVGTLNFQDVFARVRAPLQAFNDDHKLVPLPLGGQVVRAEPIKQTATGQQLQIDPNGSQVILLPVGGHIHDDVGTPGETISVRNNPKPGGLASMPYWLLVVAGLGIFLGCVGKSAQFPLHVWLPDAMEGPTPVSALIHAATMVAAGVYLVGRTFPLFTYESRLVIAYTGGITLFVAATIAIVMTDIKKVLAYSTVSQLGYMMLALGVGGWTAGLFHLLTHAFFKALLFLGSGSVIYGCHHEQEMTKMGGLYPKMKITALTMLMGVLAIGGIPLFTGWYSKDAVLAASLGFATVHKQHFLLYLLPLVTAGITAFYMFRMWFMTFTGEPRDHHVYEHAHESPRTMTIPLILLAICSVCVAWGWPLWDAEASAMEHHLHLSQPDSVVADFGRSEHDHLWEGGPVKIGERSERHQAATLGPTGGLIALGIVVVGILFAYLVYYLRALDPAEALEQFPGVHRFLRHKWFFDELYSAVLVRPAMVVALWCRAFDTYVIDGSVNAMAKFWMLVSRWNGKIDLGIVDGLVNLTADVIYAVGRSFRNVQTGYLRSYVLFMVLAAMAIVAVLSYFVTRVAAY